MSSSDAPSRSRRSQQLPVEVLARVLSLLRDAESFIRCMAVSREWHQAAKHVDCLFFDGYQYRDRLSGQDAEAMITKTIMSTTRLRSLSVMHDDPDKWLSDSTVIAWIIHTRATLRELLISNSREGNNKIHRHHPTLFRALYEQLRNSMVEKLGLDYVIIPPSIPPALLPNLHSLRLYDVRIASATLTAFIAGCSALELLRLIDLRDCESVDLHCPSLKEFVVEETAAVGSIRLDCPRLKRLLLRDVGGIASLTVEDGSKLKKVEIFTEDCKPTIDIRHAASIQHAHLLYKGDSWTHLAEFVGGMGCLRELGVCIQDDDNPPPVDLEDFALLCPGLRTLGIGPELWERLAQGDFRRGRSRWHDLSQLSIDTLRVDCVVSLLSAVLERCPSLETLNLGPRAPEDSWEDAVSSFTTSLITIAQKYPAVKVEVDFDHSYTIVPF
ncbi:F-box/RNI-like superfamily protein [Klebsormidium nitens]|uniref:F-box/RNI-like superfamily protein n=1 Tax=Klebsormidium nitens TaxID=105231 RepID=A0A1Y1IM83_KLENI|nr:F-box/RNI-like superfamily protein [Klebsormidium nitens]|eukprot:GAQ89707.1 F-box/RNI-like superfamily protein [Klebsormidium nitens]